MWKCNKRISENDKSNCFVIVSSLFRILGKDKKKQKLPEKDPAVDKELKVH